MGGYRSIGSFLFSQHSNLLFSISVSLSHLHLIHESALSLSKQPPKRQTTSKMPHPQLLEARVNTIRKADDPAWFERVHSSQKQQFKQSVRERVQEYKTRVLLLQLQPTPHAAHKQSVKEQKYIQSMLTYLHNGNRVKYEQYKTKTKQTMSDLLTTMMEQEGDFTAQVMPANFAGPSRSINFGDGTTVLICEQGETMRNEQIALRQGQKMNRFDDNLEFYDAMAEFLELYK